MKEQIEQLIREALETLVSQGLLQNRPSLNGIITPARDKDHGDFASNIALSLAKAVGMDPRTLATALVQALPTSPLIQRVEIAGPGFINFFLAEDSWQHIIPLILAKGTSFGESDLGQGKRVHIEYVSANPTGPLHVGHGRGAAYGASVANLLTATGFKVHREYYVNDAGRQMRILALSVWIRYLELHEEEVHLPKNAYQGDYISDIARKIKAEYKDRFFRKKTDIALTLADIDSDENADQYLDAYIETAKHLLGPDFDIIFQIGLNDILADIKNDLEEFGVVYDQWFLESQLIQEDLVTAGVKLLESHGFVYEKEGALWFKAMELGDEKDRVLIRKNGVPTYFASDVAYHLHKYRNGFDQIIDVFGADHHGFIARINAFLKGLGEDYKKLQVLLVQFAILYRGSEKISMSTRSGTFVTLRELRQEVGNDAARFFYIMRKPSQHLDFDLELAKSKSNENPVYYIQYAHARICSVWRQLALQQQALDKTLGLSHVQQLSSPHEKQLMSTLSQYPDVLQHAAIGHEPHLIAHYLQTLANHFHTYYNAEKFLVDDNTLRQARLVLIAAVQQVLVNGLKLLGVSAPEEM